MNRSWLWLIVIATLFLLAACTSVDTNGETVIRVSSLLCIWKWSGIAWAILSFLGFALMIQESGAIAGSAVWGTFFIIVFVFYLVFFFIRGLAA
jgi:hypothetical protein